MSPLSSLLSPPVMEYQYEVTGSLRHTGIRRKDGGPIMYSNNFTCRCWGLNEKEAISHAKFVATDRAKLAPRALAWVDVAAFPTGEKRPKRSKKGASSDAESNRVSG